jgi:hypothetical protein
MIFKFHISFILILYSDTILTRRKRRGGTSLLAKPIVKKPLTTTITKINEEPAIDNRVSVIKYVPKRSIEVIDITDDDGPLLLPTTSTDNFSDVGRRFANWILTEEREPTEVEKFRRIEKRASFKVEHNMSDTKNIMEYQQQIDDSYEAAMKHFIGGYPDDYFFSAKIEHVNLNKSIYLSPQRIGSFDKTRFLNKVFMVSQSNEEFMLDGLLNVEVVIYKKASGTGPRTTKAPQNYDEEKLKKKSVIVIKNDGKSKN